MHLTGTLFSLARRRPSYSDRLAPQLELPSDQGWPPGYLRETLLSLATTGDPAIQQDREARVETLMRAGIWERRGGMERGDRAGPGALTRLGLLA